MSKSDNGNFSEKFLDKKWAKRLSSIEETLLEYLIDYHHNKLIHFKKKDKIQITLKKFKDIPNIVNNIDQYLFELKNLSKDLRKEEENSFIKNYYLEKIKEYQLRIKIWKLKYNYKDNDLNQSEQIFKIIKKLYPLPNIQEREKFINEFIQFLNYLYDTNEFSIKEFAHIDELRTYHFYKSKKRNIKKIDFSKSISEYKNLISTNQNSNIYKSEEIKKIAESLIQLLKVKEGINIEIKDRRLFSLTSKNSLIIPKNIEIESIRLTQLLVHEVAVHGLRRVYGKRNINQQSKQLKLLQHGRISNLYIEEGLATYFEQNAFYDSSKYDVLNLFRIYLRMIAIHLGLYFEPVIVLQKLQKLMQLYCHIFREEDPEKEARILLLRLYRDFPTPVKGCVNPKIAQYLRGNREIWEFVEKGGDISELFVGKIGIGDISKLKELGFISTNKVDIKLAKLLNTI